MQMDINSLFSLRFSLLMRIHVLVRYPTVFHVQCTGFHVLGFCSKSTLKSDENKQNHTLLQAKTNWKITFVKASNTSPFYSFCILSLFCCPFFLAATCKAIRRVPKESGYERGTAQVFAVGFSSDSPFL